MNFSQLLTFISVAENGSFTKSAETLFITPPAVMKQVNALEDEIGALLFTRTNHGLQLTDAGKSFLQDAKYMVAYCDRAVEKAKEIYGNGKQRSIRIGTSIMTPAKFLLDIWTEIQRYDPYLKIELIPFENTPVNSVEILKNLGKHIDIVAGLYDDNFLVERGCKAAHMYDKKILLAIPVSSPLSAKSVIGMDDLKGKKVYIIRKNWNEHIDVLRRDLIENGVIVEDFEMFNMTAYNRAVSENVPIITVEGWEDVHPLLRLVSVEWEYKVPFGILYSPAPSKQVKDFINMLKVIYGKAK